MSSEPKLDPLPSDLAALLTEERSAVSAPRDAEARVFARLGRTIVAAPTAEPPGIADPEPSRKPWRIGSPSAVAGVFALGVAAGVVAVRFSSRPKTEARPVVVETVPLAPASPPITPWDLPALPASVSAPPVSSSRSPASITPSASTQSLSAERAILDVARTALVRGDGASSLAATERHEKQFPAGALAEERDALAIQALVLLKRDSEAQARGARFKQRYPHSIFGPLVDDTLRSIP